MGCLNDAVQRHQKRWRVSTPPGLQNSENAYWRCSAVTFRIERVYPCACMSARIPAAYPLTLEMRDDVRPSIDEDDRMFVIIFLVDLVVGCTKNKGLMAFPGAVDGVLVVVLYPDPALEPREV